MKVRNIDTIRYWRAAGYLLNATSQRPNPARVKPYRKYPERARVCAHTGPRKRSARPSLRCV